jgi:hypothetical protein
MVKKTLTYNQYKIIHNLLSFLATWSFSQYLSIQGPTASTQNPQKTYDCHVRADLIFYGF